MSSIYFFFFAIVLLGGELLYFRIARSYKILDHPNVRSLHERPTIRGGGIIFYLAAVLFYAITLRPGLLFIVSLTLVSVVGLIDDVRSLSSGTRFLAQSVAFAMILVELELPEVGTLMIIVIFIVSVAAVNTFNFMDGINGMTGGYGLVALGSLLYINSYNIQFIENDFLLAVLAALLIFCYFNFRKKAVCFAGDVGSLSIGFIILYLVIKLVTTTGNYNFVVLLSVYGVDSVLTIIHRLIRREDIFKPHKLHLYQVLVSQFKISHLRMSGMYVIIQLLINVLVIACLRLSLGQQYLMSLGVLMVLALLYVYLKRRIFSDIQAG